MQDLDSVFYLSNPSLFKILEIPTVNHKLILFCIIIGVKFEKSIDFNLHLLLLICVHHHRLLFRFLNISLKKDKKKKKKSHSNLQPPSTSSSVRCQIVISPRLPCCRLQNNRLPDHGMNPVPLEFASIRVHAVSNLAQP